MLPLIENSETISGKQTLKLIACTGRDIFRREMSSFSSVLQRTVNQVSCNSVINLERSIPDELWSVAIDEAQMAQLMQVIVAKYTKCFQVGTIKISAQNRIICCGQIPELKDGKYVVLNIETTSNERQGTYLRNTNNLIFMTKIANSFEFSIALSITRKHKGIVRIKSHLGQGISLSIYFPALDNVFN